MHAKVACVCGRHGIRACVMCVHGVSEIRGRLVCVACVGVYAWDVREWRAGMCDVHACMCSIILFNFNPASSFKSACTARSHTHTRAHTPDTYAHANTHTYTRTDVRENLVFENLLRGKKVVEVTAIAVHSAENRGHIRDSLGVGL